MNTSYHQHKRGPKTKSCPGFIIKLYTSTATRKRRMAGCIEQARKESDDSIPCRGCIPSSELDLYASSHSIIHQRTSEVEIDVQLLI